MNNEFMEIQNEKNLFGIDSLKKKIQFLTVKNALKKDMEVVFWKLKLNDVFDNFEIYSNPSSELNSFEMAVCREYLIELNLENENMIYFVTSLCIDHFFHFTFSNKNQMTSKEIDILSEKYTSYLLDVGNVDFKDDSELSKVRIKSKFNFHMKGGGNDPTTVDRFLNLKALI